MQIFFEDAQLELALTGVKASRILWIAGLIPILWRIAPGVADARSFHGGRLGFPTLTGRPDTRKNGR
jgi:hypothetical protein